MTNRISILFGFLLVLCNGCTPSVEEVSDSRSLPELTESMIASAEEFDFLLADDAGTDSYESCVSQMKATLDSLSESLPSSGLDDARAEKLATTVESAKAAYETLANTVQDGASAAKMSEANSRFQQKSKAILKFLK